MCKEGMCLCRVRDAGFFEEDVFPGFEGLDCPFVVESVGEGDVYGVDGGVVY